MKKFVFIFILLTVLPLFLLADIEKLPIKGNFIVSITSDNSGGVWIGSEDDGVFRYDNNGNVKQYTTKNGLGDNNGYALAVDRQNRLWVGHQYSGVSVFNGEKWQNYDVMDGPIGERIFDIQICPVDGDVWIATSAGISRYKNKTDEWEDLTRADGLPEDQCSTLAFQEDGTLIAGTQCSGVPVFKRETDGSYQHVKNIAAPQRFGKNSESPVQLEPTGNGLPSNQINKILVTKNGKVWIATAAGLAESDQTLQKIRFVRGKDYADKVRGLYGGAPKDWKECTPEIMKQLLPEDFVTSIAPAAAADDKLYLGFRQKGLVLYNPKTQEQSIFGRNEKLPDNFVTTIVSDNSGNVFAGTYGGGAARIKSVKTGKDKAESASAVQKEFPPLPGTVKPLSAAKLRKIQQKLESLNEPLPELYAAVLGEDWKTKGDWVGRTYHDWAVLCAVTAPFDHPLYFTTRYYSVHEFIGPNYKEPDDVLRRWVHWLKTDNPKTLYDPIYGYRRQAEWDDHGEVYPMTIDGPDIWYILRIREPGTYKLGMYFFNKDGHGGNNRLRDYSIEIYPGPRDWKMHESLPFDPSDWVKHSEFVEKQVKNISPLAKSRVQNFWGGVHKQFIVTGKNYYFVKIDRNYSYNTILSSVSVDRLTGKPTDEEPLGIPWLNELRNIPEIKKNFQYGPPPLPENTANGKGTLIGRIWTLADGKYAMKGNVEWQRKARIAAYQTAARCADEGEDMQQLLKSLKWRLNQWDDEQREEWYNVMSHSHRGMILENPSVKKTIDQYKDRVKEDDPQ
ncbi:MAG: hypothetical protein LBH00_05370 [Planctomycetaceae bacterium]|jgi:hypothetical protein|nr:hypothetical protein [Planctomycetaceae bacterium]